VKIRWTKRAKNSFDQILDYLQEEWSLTSAINFVKKTNDFIETLKNQPKIGRPEIARKDLRSFVLTRQIAVFYRIKNYNEIVLLKFFDTRQSPLKKTE
jgi:plasmid stabilization system protein ParE